MSFRVRWPFVLAAALFAALCLLDYLWPDGGHDAFADNVPTAAQARPAVELVASLPQLPGTTADPYDTACGLPTPYCVTSSSLSGRQLATNIRALLVLRGAKIAKRLSCDPFVAGPADCLSTVTFRGVRIAVWGSGAREFEGIRRPARGFVTVDGAIDPNPTSRALGDWRTLGLFPASWGAPPCVTVESGGCGKYAGPLTLAMPPRRATDLVRSRLAAWGLAIHAAHCASNGARGGCFYAGMKYRTLGGHDPVVVSVAVQADAGSGTTTVLVHVDT